MACRHRCAKGRPSAYRHPAFQPDFREAHGGPDAAHVIQVTAHPAALAAIGDDTIDRDAVAQHGAHGSGRDDRHAIAGPNRALDRPCRGFLPRPVTPWLSPSASPSTAPPNPPPPPTPRSTPPQPTPPPP